MDCTDLQAFEGSDVLERLAWFPWLTMAEFHWFEEITERGIQIAMLVEEDGIAVYRVDR